MMYIPNLSLCLSGMFCIKQDIKHKFLNFHNNLSHIIYIIHLNYNLNNYCYIMNKFILRGNNLFNTSYKQLLNLCDRITSILLDKACRTNLNNTHCSKNYKASHL